MRKLRLSLFMAVIVVMSVCVDDMTSSAGNYPRGGQSGSYQEGRGHGGGGHSGGYYGGRGHGGDHSGGHYRGGGHYGYSYGGYYWGGPYWSALWYAPFYYPYYYPAYSPYYYPYAPEVTVTPMPDEYIERSDRGSSRRSSDVWYFCPESRAYYPYVKECPEGWETVPAQPRTGRER